MPVAAVTWLLGVVVLQLLGIPAFSSVLPDSAAVKHEVEFAASGVRSNPHDLSFDEIELLREMFQRSSSLTKQLSHNQVEIANAINNSLPCKKNETVLLRDHQFSYTSSAYASEDPIHLSDDMIGATGMPQRLFFSPQLLGETSLSALRQKLIGELNK
jgi:hypothetical protein